jgi:hypothetical protein
VTIRGFYFHPIIFNGGTRASVLSTTCISSTRGSSS